MNTLDRDHIELLKDSENYVILLGNLEFGMSRKQLKRITELHNWGFDFEEISEIEQRDPYEVIIALLHQARTNNVRLRPFAYRR